jgi:hypothetical protein
VRTPSLLLLLLFSVTGTAAQPVPVGVAPTSISVDAPLEAQHNPHLKLGAPFHSWIVASGTVTIAPDGRVTDLTLQPISIAGLSSKLGAFQPMDRTLVPDDAERFERAARAALERAVFEPLDGDPPRRSFVNLAWKARGGSMDIGAAESGGALRRAPGVLARTFAKGTTFYLWGGPDVAVEARRLAPVEDADRREALGLPSATFVEALAPRCPVVAEAPEGVYWQQLDDGLQPREPLQLEYPYSERSQSGHGIVVLVLQVAPNGSVSAVHPTHAVPGRPAFAESAITSACRLRFNLPRLNGEPVHGLYWQHAEFTSQP